ncbi:NADH-quinone oxidoreductase subunit H [Amnibacterium endophyticum]|uniref:NADH-quinone oxidoreductase subunit H n=1 Tax=Amnibacterium endophyticum TaxID=2109337 RepID=A0ABW4LGQ2_9MICO
MPEMVSSALLAVAAPFGLLLLAATGAAGAAVLSARAAGAPLVAAAGAPLLESARLLRQQRRTLPGADVLLWRIAGAGFVAAAVLKVLVVPVGGAVAADLPIGVVWFNAMDVLLWALWWLLGWGADSTFSLVGAYRFLGQAISYELPLMFALTGPAIAAGSLRMSDVVAAQQPVWFAVLMPVGFVVYLLSVSAFAAWGPFATPAGRDAADGVLTELSGPDRLLVLAGRWAVLAAGAAVAVPLFLGGGAGPLLPAGVWVAVKSVLVLAVLVVAGRLVPAVRPERLAEIGWLVLLPATLLQLLAVSIGAAVAGGAP